MTPAWAVTVAGFLRRTVKMASRPDLCVSSVAGHEAASRDCEVGGWLPPVPMAVGLNIDPSGTLAAKKIEPLTCSVRAEVRTSTRACGPAKWQPSRDINECQPGLPRNPRGEADRIPARCRPPGRTPGNIRACHNRIGSPVANRVSEAARIGRPTVRWRARRRQLLPLKSQRTGLRLSSANRPRRLLRQRGYDVVLTLRAPIPCELMHRRAARVIPPLAICSAKNASSDGGIP